jgi:putative ABC transport system permease protein
MEASAMWLIALRDLQWRRRRFAIAVGATALVFALTLVLAGAGRGMRAEASRIVAEIGADAWLVPAGTTGPFTASSVLPASSVEIVANVDGVASADPFVFLRYALGDRGPLDVNVLGYRPTGLGSPDVDRGRALESAGEVVVDDTLGIAVGDTIQLGDRRMTVVGVAGGVTFNFGLPTVFASIDDVQALAFAGQPFVTAVVTQGVPASVPAGLRLLTNADVVADARRPMKAGLQTVDFINLLLWLIAAGIVGSIVYLSALERVRDFAVLKATGASNSSLLATLVVQAIVLSLAAALLAVVLARFLEPGFPFSIETSLTAYLSLPVIAIAVGLLASLAGLRRALRVDPALAFGGR